MYKIKNYKFPTNNINECNLAIKCIDKVIIALIPKLNIDKCYVELKTILEKKKIKIAFKINNFYEYNINDFKHFTNVNLIESKKQQLNNYAKNYYMLNKTNILKKINYKNNNDKRFFCDCCKKSLLIVRKDEHEKTRLHLKNLTNIVN